MINTEEKINKRVFAVAGPKGGVGKSTISANLALAFAEAGSKVTIADLDLGAANLHALLGIRDTGRTLDDFILKKVKNLSEVLIKTEVPNLSLICGGSQVPNIANMPYQQKVKLMNHLIKLESDILIIDLGAGSSYNVVDFSFIADTGLFVTTPEVTSLMNLYSFIKSSVFRRLTFHFKAEKAYDMLELLDKARDVEANPHLNSMEKILIEAEKVDPESVAGVKKLLSEFVPHIIVNRVQTKGDANVGNVLQGLLQNYLSIHSKTLANLPEDTAVKKSINKMRPVLLDNPSSEFSNAIRKLAEDLTIH
ncbi:P-loop NTPase [bacterium]|nr:P-loop NTPase [bacterium]